MWTGKPQNPKWMQKSQNLKFTRKRDAGQDPPFANSGRLASLKGWLLGCALVLHVGGPHVTKCLHLQPACMSVRRIGILRSPEGEKEEEVTP